MKKCALLLLTIAFVFSACNNKQSEIDRYTVKTNVLEAEFSILIDEMVNDLVFNKINIEKELITYIESKEMIDQIINLIKQVEYKIISENFMANNQEAVLVLEMDTKNLFSIIQTINITNLLAGKNNSEIDINILVEDLAVNKVVTSVYLEKKTDGWIIVQSEINNDFFNCLSGNIYQHLYY